MEQDGEDRRDPRPHEHAEERGKLLIRAGRKVVDAGRQAVDAARQAVDAAGHVGEASIELLVRAFQARESNFHLRVLTRTLSRPATVPSGPIAATAGRMLDSDVRS